MVKQYQTQPWLRHYHWAKNRCKNPNNRRFTHYGGRGILFLLTTLEIKTLWFRDKAYEMKKPSIDREDNNGNYEFNNCRFLESTKNTAERNKRILSIRVHQYNLHGILLQTWFGVREIERQLKINQSNIIKCCKGKAKSAGGFRWTYAR
jgi:hypothetical protein